MRRVRTPQPPPGLEVRAANDLDGRECMVGRKQSGDGLAIERALAEIAHQHPAPVVVGRDQGWDVARPASARASMTAGSDGGLA